MNIVDNMKTWHNRQHSKQKTKDEAADRQRQASEEAKERDTYQAQLERFQGHFQRISRLDNSDQDRNTRLGEVEVTPEAPYWSAPHNDALRKTETGFEMVAVETVVPGEAYTTLHYLVDEETGVINLQESTRKTSICEHEFNTESRNFVLDSHQERAKKDDYSSIELHSKGHIHNPLHRNDRWPQRAYKGYD